MNRYYPPIGPIMNPMPLTPAYPVDPYGAEMNPVPGNVDSYDFGLSVLKPVYGWAKAMAKDQQDEVLKYGAEVLHFAARAGASQFAVNELKAGMQSLMDVMREAARAKAAASVAVPGTSGSSGSDMDKGSTEGLSWYEPDPNRFYVLDNKSGVALAAVLDDLRNTDRYLARGARAPNRLLFVGRPGTGKTTGAFWLGSQLNLPVALIRLDGVASSLVGKKEKNLRACIEEAMKRECLIVLDEFESVAVPRSNQGANVGQWSRDCTGALLQLIDSLPAEQAFIGATNHADIIDNAVRERMREQVLFYPPNREARAHMLQKWWGLAHHEGEAKRILLDRSKGFSGRLLEVVADVANRAAARRSLREKISVADVEAAVAAAMAGMTADDLAMLASVSDADDVVTTVPSPAPVAPTLPKVAPVLAVQGPPVPPDALASGVRP